MTTLVYYNSSFDWLSFQSTVLSAVNVSLVSSLEIIGDYIIAENAGYVEAVFQVQMAGSTVPLIESFRIYNFAPTAGLLLPGKTSRRSNIALPANTGLSLVWTQSYNVKQVGLTVNFSGSGP